MRVLLLVTDLQPGGTPLRIARLALELKALDVDAHLGCLAPPGPVSADLERQGVPTFACGARSALALPAMFRLLLHVRRIRPDLIHTTLMHANVSGRLISFLTGVPVIGSTATIEVERRTHRRLERATIGLERAHIVNSPALREHVIQSFRAPPGRVCVVPASVRRFALAERAAARTAFNLPPDAFVAAWVGRFDPVKRLPLLLRAAARLRERNVTWLLAGDGPERPRIERLIAELDLTPRVCLAGWLEDLGPFFAATDWLVFPSLTEGLPNAVLEALAAGVPVLATRSPTLEALAAELPGITLAADNEAALAEAIGRLIDDPAALAAQRTAARAAAANLPTPAAAARAVLQVYQQVLAETAKP